MPNVLVETRGGWLGAKRTALLDAIHAATVEALRIPPDALVLRLVRPSGPEQACFLNTPLTIRERDRVAPPGISLPPPVLQCPLAHGMSKCE
jgi:hypothetical protein